MYERVTCPVEKFCRNADILCDSCIGCRHSDQWEQLGIIKMMLHYRPNQVRAPKHPYQFWLHKRELARKRELKRSAPVKRRRLQTKRASRNEERTRTAIVQATKRSGALNHDGDSRLGNGEWGVDDKLQSTARAQFTVRVAEVDKASLQRCVVVVTTADGRKFVIADLEDFVAAAASLAASLGQIVGKDQSPACAPSPSAPEEIQR